MTLELPFDPTRLEREPESATRARHDTFVWRPRKRRTIRHADFRLDPDLAALPPVGERANRFDREYVEPPVHVTRIDDGVLFGQGFLLCSAGRPTISAERVYCRSCGELRKRLPELRRRAADPDTVYLAGAHGGWRNFYHWLLECVTSAVLLERIASRTDRPYRLVLPPLAPHQSRTLELAGIPMRRCITLNANECLRDVPLLYTDALNGRFSLRPSPELIGLLDPLRERARAAASDPMPSRFYVSRRDTSARRLVNEDELVAALEKEGYRELVLSELSIERQVAAFAGADRVVAPHGAGLAHLMFAPPGCRVLEILPENHRFAFFFRLAQVRGLRYSMVLARGVSGGRPTGEHGAVRVDVDRVLRELESSTRSPYAA